MKTEATAIIEIIRLVAVLAGFFGVVITAEEQEAIAAGLVALVGLVSVALAIWNRQNVYSSVTTQKIADRAAATGNIDIGDPPTGKTDPPAAPPPGESHMPGVSG